jgi:hypothetical protein
MYTDEQKYDGVNHSFDYKLSIFLDICRRNDLPENLLSKAFPIMLKGIALDHYYNNMLSQCSYQDVCSSFCTFFEGPGYHQRNLDQWNQVTLSTIMTENQGKTLLEGIQLLLSKL